MNKLASIWLILLQGIISSLYAQNDKLLSSEFYNTNLLNDLFAKLEQLEREKVGKVNIVHIGDSHIQADIMTNNIRQALQKQFGNGGYGITFPYSLAKTSGTHLVKYKSNIEWKSLRNIYAVSDISVGISGIALYSNNGSFEIDLTASNDYEFNTVKIFHPFIQAPFTIVGAQPVAVNKNIVSTSNTSPKSVTTHLVARGETLYRISRYYNIDIEDLKKTNNITSNTIQVGRVLTIPQSGNNVEKEQKIETTPTTNMNTSNESITISESPTLNPYVSVYNLSSLQKNITIIPQRKQLGYNLSGISIENDKPGVIYHSIGVNGAKANDFNKHQLFFDQLATLSPDLVIISFGTNESFGKMSATAYINKMNQLVSNILKRNKNTAIIVTTPPPSFFKRKTPNSLADAYAKQQILVNNYVIWDLNAKLKQLSKTNNTSIESFMAKDKIHYNREGYRQMGNIFVNDFLNAYTSYKRKTIK